MFVGFTFEFSNKGNLILPTLEGLVQTEDVDLEGTEEEAHVVAAETDRIAFLHPAHFRVVFELFGILFKPKQL